MASGNHRIIESSARFVCMFQWDIMGRFHVDISRDISKLWIYSKCESNIFETVLGNIYRTCFEELYIQLPLETAFFEARNGCGISSVSARRQRRIGGPARRSRRSLPKWWAKKTGMYRRRSLDGKRPKVQPRCGAWWRGVSLDLDGLHRVIPSFEHDFDGQLYSNYFYIYSNYTVIYYTYIYIIMVMVMMDGSGLNW